MWKLESILKSPKPLTDLKGSVGGGGYVEKRDGIRSDEEVTWSGPSSECNNWSIGKYRAATKPQKNWPTVATYPTIFKRKKKEAARLDSTECKQQQLKGRQVWEEWVGRGERNKKWQQQQQQQLLRCGERFLPECCCRYMSGCGQRRKKSGGKSGSEVDLEIGHTVPGLSPEEEKKMCIKTVCGFFQIFQKWMHGWKENQTGIK